jgi:endonuclease/exonuclease/phosphatase family metal-dependent hydrolase
MKICTFNVENFYLSPLHQGLDGHIEQRILQPGDTALKRVELLGQVFRDINADIFGLQEVFNEETLNEFNQHFLKDRYLVSLIEGNSDRGINIAYLVKKNLPYRLEHLTHRSRPITPPGQKAYYLSRDLAELRLFDKKTDELSMIFLCVHLKSKRSDTSSDFGGKKQRKQEFDFVLETYIQLKKRFGPELPIFLMGDFNGVIWREQSEEEFSGLFERTDLIDTLEALQYPLDKRTTQFSFNRQKDVLATQFDYLFLPKATLPLLDAKQSGIYRFKDQEGNQIPLPQTSEQRSRLPSDHFPVVATLNITLNPLLFPA